MCKAQRVWIGRLFEQCNPSPSSWCDHTSDSFCLFVWNHRELANSLLILYVTGLSEGVSELGFLLSRIERSNHSTILSKTSGHAAQQKKRENLSVGHERAACLCALGTITYQAPNLIFPSPCFAPSTPLQDMSMKLCIYLQQPSTIPTKLFVVQSWLTVTPPSPWKGKRHLLGQYSLSLGLQVQNIHFPILWIHCETSNCNQM